MTKSADQGLSGAAILIAGPTASGKSSLAVEVARAFNGVVINADSMQVYGDLSILTARPTAAEQAGVPHHLFGHVDAGRAYSVAEWHADAMHAVQKAWREGRLPILAGGTGLYFRAILEGLAPVPDIPDDIRISVRHLREKSGAEALFDALSAEDTEMAARLNPGDGQRVARALEVVRATGKSLAHWQSKTVPGGLAAADGKGHVLKLVLEMDREALYERIEQRFDKMIEVGALEEVRALAVRRLSADLPAMKALGVPQILSILADETDESDALALAKQQTRRYAKRQATWFRHQLSGWKTLDAQFSERKKNEIFSKIRKIMLTSQE